MHNKIPLKQVVNFVSRGISPKYSDNGYLVINQRCIRENRIDFENARFTDEIKTKIRNEKFLKKWDVLINSTGVGTLGRVAQLKKIYKNLTVDSHVTILRPALEKVDGCYFGYSICEIEKIIEKLGKGATGQTELSRNDLLGLNINLFSIEAQEKIASILSAYDELIENNNRRIEILEEMAETIYKEWFVHFRFPGYEKVKMVDSELGKIPITWSISNLGKIANIRKEKFNEVEHKNLQLLDLARIPRKSLIVNSYGKYNEVNTSRIIFEEDDILFGSIRPYFHKVIFAMKKGITNVSVLVVRPIDYNYMFPYLFCFLFDEDTIKWATKQSGGTKMPVISWKILKRKKIIIPDDNLIFDFNKKLYPILNLIKRFNRKNDNLKNTRDLLLPKLISGKIDVSDLYIKTEEIK